MCFYGLCLTIETLEQGVFIITLNMFQTLF